MSYDVPSTVTIRVRKKNKSAKEGRIVKFQYNSMGIVFDGSNAISVEAYATLDEIDEHGQVVADKVMDITGRNIEIGSWLAFSRTVYSSHGLSIGQVKEITNAGWLKCSVGVKSRNSHNASEHMVRDPDRSLILPFDESEFVMYRLTDFRSLED